MLNRYYRSLDNSWYEFPYELTEAQILLYLQGQTNFVYEKKTNVPKTVQLMQENGELTNVVVANEFVEQIEELPNNGVFVENFISHGFTKVPDWTAFKNSIFNNQPLFSKCLTANAYNLVSGMILSAESKQLVLENNFLIALNMLKTELQDKGTPFTAEELVFINEKLFEFEFSIQL